MSDESSYTSQFFQLSFSDLTLSLGNPPLSSRTLQKFRASEFFSRSGGASSGRNSRRARGVERVGSTEKSRDRQKAERRRRREEEIEKKRKKERPGPEVEKE